jgi:hypothetical protein
MPRWRAGGWSAIGLVTLGLVGAFIAALDPQLCLFAVIGFGAGFLLRAKLFWKALGILVMSVLGIILVLFVFSLLQGCLSLSRFEESGTYTIHIRFDPSGRLWVIEEQVLLPKSLNAKYNIKPEDVQGAKPLVLSGDYLGNWVVEGFRDERLLLRRNRISHQRARLFPFTTIIELGGSWFKSYEEFVVGDRDSRFVIEAPVGMISRTDPAFSKREQALEGDFETFVAPLAGESPAGFGLTLRLISPLLDNVVMGWLTWLVTWPPLKWALFLLFAVFSDQIKERLLNPLVKSFLDWVGMGKKEPSSPGAATDG